MGYDSTVAFTLDTICPWTYLGYIRLQRALTTYRTTNPSSPVTFALRILPYQLYPDFAQDGVDKHEWYRDERYGGSEQRFQKYAAYMTALAKDEGKEFDFEGGQIANTFHAHRVLQYIQDDKGHEAALTALEALYTAYFEKRAHPSSPETLTAACLAAGLSDQEAETVVAAENVHARETKSVVQEQAGNGIDSVPHIVFEGRKRDFTLVGAKEVGEYVRTLEQVVKEAT